MEKNKLIIIIIISVIFGLGAGVVGEIISRVYIMESAFGVPLYGEINLGSNSGSNVIIREAKKVVVEQNEKLAETARGIENSVVGVFKKIVIADTGKNELFQPGNYYQIDKALGQGFIITSDGWLISTFLPDEFKKNTVAIDQIKLKQDVVKNYVIVTKDRKVYTVDNTVYDKESSLSFWHIKATGLPVKRFVLKNELMNGQSVFAYNIKGWTWPTSILGQAERNTALVRSSDSCQSEIVLAETPGADMSGALLFDYNGGLIAILNSHNKISPIYNHLNVIGNILKSNSLKRPVLGLNYIELANLAGTESVLEKGALISADPSGLAVIKGSAAAKAGLVEGDVVLAVNNTDINADNDLCSMIQQFAVGDEISISYMRDGEKKETRAVLTGK